MVHPTHITRASFLFFLLLFRAGTIIIALALLFLIVLVFVHLGTQNLKVLLMVRNRSFLSPSMIPLAELNDALLQHDKQEDRVMVAQH